MAKAGESASRKRSRKTSKTDQLLANQKKILAKLEILDELSAEVEEELEQENIIRAGEALEAEQIRKIETLERKLQKEIENKPLQKITYRDFSKSAIGALFGILGHFAFFYGIEIASTISVFRATMLYIFAFLIGAIFLYLTGYRSFKTKVAIRMAPIRLLIIYFTSLAIIIFVLFLYDFKHITGSPLALYKSVATISILAVLGAATADLIGKEP
ncbi:MAG: hypothetical protein ACOCWQ_00340 [Nanoarchaeota archaeon]